MWGAYFLNYSDRQAVFSMFPVLQRDLQMSDTHLGLTGSIFLWVYGACCPIAGQLGDRFSKRLLVASSLVVWSVVTVATGFAASGAALLTLRGVMGVARASTCRPPSPSRRNSHAPAQRSRAIAALTTAQIAGSVGGAWFGGWMAEHGHWREAFFILGAVGLLYAMPYIAFLRGIEEERPAAKTEAAGPAIARVVFHADLPRCSA